ncbi:30S ribosomal protein S8 [Candidatus Uhrbacteria bacterium]|nr:30S ribosomal protein S8 [Candidatus Uhrbacteria bacterium]
MTDQIADLLSRIRNALKVHKAFVTLPYSRVKRDILVVLKQEGYILESETGEEAGLSHLKVSLRYMGGKTPAIRTLKRISKPGSRVYAKSKELPIVLNDLGIAVVSTSCGIMTNREARKRGLGGEILCEIS